MNLPIHAYTGGTGYTPEGAERKIWVQVVSAAGITSTDNEKSLFPECSEGENLDDRSAYRGVYSILFG